jgi:ubiquinone/menaquinone biosynthesis C-methylase UbiE
MKTAIRSLNRAHYSGETAFYSSADLRPIEAQLIASLPPKRRVLDVGCGPARVSSRLAYAGHSVTGIDLVAECIAAAHATSPQTSLPNLCVGDMCDLPFHDGAFDEVWCLRFSFNALGCPDERIKALREMRRVCAPSGRLLIESFNYFYPGRLGLMWAANAAEEVSRTLRKLAGSPSPRPRRGDLLYLASKSEGAAPGYAYIPTPSELNRMCSQAGLTRHDLVPPQHLLSPTRRDRVVLTSYSIWIRCVYATDE